MKLRLENGNFKMAGAAPGTEGSTGANELVGTLPVGLATEDFIGCVFELSSEMEKHYSIPLDVSENINEPDYIAVEMFNGSFFYNKLTGNFVYGALDNPNDPETDPRAADPDGR